MPNLARGEVRWTEHGAVARVALGMAFGLLALGCQRDIVKTWEEGGKIEAKISAEKCPDAGAAAPPAKHTPHGVAGECKEYPDGGFSVLTRLTIVERLQSGERAPNDRDEIWRIGCFSGVCDAARLDGSTLANDEPLRAFQLTSFRGVVLSRRDNVVTTKFEGLADQRLTIDLSKKTIAYKQTYKSGATAVGDGSCVGKTGGEFP